MTEETKTDEWGKWLKSPKGSWMLIEMSQKYIDEQLTPRHERGLARKASQEHQVKVSERMIQLGESRAHDPTKIAEEDAVFAEVTGTIGTEELEQIVEKLGWLADKTFAQVDNYIINNVGNLTEAKAFLRILAKIMLANLKLTMMLLNRELPPETP